MKIRNENFDGGYSIQILVASCLTSLLRSSRKYKIHICQPGRKKVHATIKAYWVNSPNISMTFARNTDK